MSFLSGLGHFFGISSPGSSMSAADSTTEDTIQAALDKLVTGPKAFGNRTMTADQAENALRAQGVLPAGWRLRESDSTSSGYRPTQAATKTMGALHAAEIGAAAFTGGASLAGSGIGLGTTAALQGGLGAAGGLASGGGVKGALIGGGLGAAGGFVPGASSGLGLAERTAIQGGLGAAKGLASGGGLKGALLGGAAGSAAPALGSVAPSVTSSGLGQQAINAGIGTGLNTVRTGSFDPTSAAVGAAGSFLPSATSGLSPTAQRLLNLGGSQGLGLLGSSLASSGSAPKMNTYSSFLPGEGTPAGVNPALMLTATDPTTGQPIDPAAAAAAAGSDPSFAQRWGPLIAQGAGAVGGIYASRAAQQAALNRSPEEAAALARASGAAGQLGQAGQSLLDESKPYIAQPAAYYQTLLNGNRAAMANAVAPARAAINDSYRGATTNLAQSGVRGAAKDVLAGNLARQRASQVAGLTTGVQPGAAAALASLGTGQQAAGLGAVGQSGNIYNSLLGSAANKATQASQEGTQTGASVGKLIADLGTTAFGGKKPAAGATTTKPKTPASTTPSGPDYGSSTTVPDANAPYYGPVEGAPPPPPILGDFGSGGGDDYGSETYY